jgi:XTP/dITP diphosphohydrolase
MARLVLVDTSDQLPGLLPMHGWSALMSSELVLVGEADHPFATHLDLAELRFEVVPQLEGRAPLTRSDMLAGLSPEQKKRAEWVVDRARAVGEVTYLFGPADSEAFTRTLGMEATRAGVEVEVVYFMVAPKGSALLELVGVEERLRGPGGCPWDREQDHRTLAKYAVEEVYELVEAIAGGDPDHIREELGDVLLQVVFHAQIAADEGTFDIDDVARGIVDKLVRRHPHVFADTEVADADEVMANWEELKAAEKPEREGVFDGVPTAQPALGYVEKLQKRAAKIGFDWQADVDAAERIRAELDEFLAAADDAEREHEIGDLLMSVVGLARRHHIDPELALRGAAQRFRARFEAMVAGADRPLEELTAAQWTALWEAVKSGAAPPESLA